MDYKEFTEALTELDGNVNLLRLEEPMKQEEQRKLRQAWEIMNERLIEQKEKPKSLLILPHKINIEDARHRSFDFSTALRLMDMGCKVERDTWTQGHIYKEKGIILQSHDNKEWIPTQGAMRAINWRMV